MRKLLCALMVILLIIPTYGLAATASPSITRLVYNKSDITILLQNEGMIYNKLDERKDILKVLEKELGSTDYFIDDLFMVILSHKYDLVKWHFTKDYNSDNRVFMVLFNENQYYVLEGLRFLKYIVIDFEGVNPDTYYVVIVSK